MPVLSSQDYQRLDRILSLITLGANAAGAAVTFFYLAYVNPIPEPQVSPPAPASAWMSFLVSALATLLLLFVGNWLGNRGRRHFPAWIPRILDGEDSRAAPLEAQREVLQYPVTIALTSLAMWFLAGIFLGYLMSGGWQGFLTIFGVGGILTSAIVYFAINTLWRPVVGLFFEQARPSQVPAWKISVLPRLILAFVLIGLYPVLMLAFTSLSRAQAMVTSADPGLVLQNLIFAVGLTGSITLVLGLALSILVARSIVQPLGQLQQAMQRVGQNDLNVHLLPASNDELGFLVEGFNDMVSGLRRAETLRNLLNLYISPEVAREALEHGTRLGGQVVECSVLFSDIRGFTALSEQISAQALIALLNRYMSRMVNIVIAHGGIVNKFGGDSVLAVFGTPLNPAEDHAARAVRTALQMRQALEAFNTEQVQQGEPQLRIGIGIASGPVVAGNVGGEGRIEYTVIGDTVNLASRLQDLTKDLQHGILASAATVNQAMRFATFDVEALESIQVRGKTEPLKVFAIRDAL